MEEGVSPAPQSQKVESAGNSATQPAGRSGVLHLSRSITPSWRGFVLLISTILILLVVIFFQFSSFPRATFKERINALNASHFKTASSSAALTSSEVEDKFIKPVEDAEQYKNGNKEMEKAYKFGRYLSVFTSLVGEYYATHDKAILPEIDKLRGFIKANFPRQYESAFKDVPGFWDVQI